MEGGGVHPLEVEEEVECGAACAGRKRGVEGAYQRRIFVLHGGAEDGAHVVQKRRAYLLKRSLLKHECVNSVGKCGDGGDGVSALLCARGVH